MRILGFVGRLAVTAAFFMLAAASGARADVVTMDSFSVNGSLFTDNFNLTGTLSGTADSGVAANTAPSPTEIFYNVTGSFSEGGGKATLNTANGALQSSPPPFDPLVQQVSAIFSPTVFSFARASALTVSGIFDLSVPTTLGAVYGIEFVDLNLSHNGDVIGLRVVETATGPKIQLVNVNHFNGTFTIVDSTVLDPGHDQIELNLFKSASSDTVGGSFGYLDGGTLNGGLTDFTNTTTLALDGARSIAPGFNAFAPVPEPGTLALFGSGLAGLFWLRRSKKEKRAGSRAA